METNLTNQIEQVIAEIPKVELHLHLEGAIPLETLFQFIQRKEPNSLIKSLDELRQKFTYTDFAHFIELWIWKNTFITDEGDFEEIAYQVLGDLSKQHVKYVEAFYSPGDFWEQGFSIPGITEAIIAGKEQAYRDFGIQSVFIIDLIRDHGPERGMRYLEEVTPYLGKGVIGIGLGGSEQNFPADPYAELYQEAKKRGFRLTAHAGEAENAQSIRTVIEKLGVERIGHGLRAYEDPELVALLKERQIPLEMCVVSNVKTGVCESVESHPIKDYFQKGLMVTVNSDDPAMFNTSLNQEYLVLAQQLGFTLDDLKRVSLNGIEASFLPDEEKERMKAQFEHTWQELLKKFSP
jgi:adenosine deaminase